MGFCSIREGRTIRPLQITSQELPPDEQGLHSSADLAAKKEAPHALVMEDCDRAVCAGGPAKLSVEDGQGVETPGVRRFPVDSIIVARVFARWSDGDRARAIQLCQSRAKPTRLVSGQLPGLARVQGIGGGALGFAGLLVISSDHDDMVVVIRHDGKNSGRSVAVSNRGFRDSPIEPSVIRVKDASGRAAGREENVLVTGKREAAITCRKRAFSRQRRGHVVNRKPVPMLAVGGPEQEELAVDRIAQRKAVFFGTAGDGVEEKFLAIVRELQLPGFAAVGGLVDSGFCTFSAREDIGNGGMEGHDATEVELVAFWDVKVMPGLTSIKRPHNYAIRAGGPNNRNRRPFFTWANSNTHAAQVAVHAAGCDVPVLRLRGRAPEQEERDKQKIRDFALHCEAICSPPHDSRRWFRLSSRKRPDEPR